MNRIYLRSLFFSFVLISLVGCSTSPLGQNNSARSLGKGEFKSDLILNLYEDADTGRSTLFPNLQLTHGLSDNLDFSLRTEFESVTLIPKYSFINNEEGFSLAGQVGLAYIASRLSYLAGTVVSYKAGRFEPYLGARYNIVNYDSSQFDSNYFEVPPDLRFNFYSVTPGFNYWITPTVAVGSEFIMIITDDTEVKFKRSEVYSLNFSFLF